jgi:predicted transcriptional regulator
MDTLPVRPERMKALEAYAQQLGKDPAEVLDDALAKFLDYETWFARAVEEGIDAAGRGEFIEHEDVGKLIEDRYSG